MHFIIIDGKPKWAIAKRIAEFTIVKEVYTDEGLPIIEEEIFTDIVYLFDESELITYPDAELIEQPTPEILARASQIEGTEFSRSEFEKLLNEKTPIELMQEQNATMFIALAEKDIQIGQQTSMIAELMISVAQLQMGGM